MAKTIELKFKGSFGVILREAKEKGRKHNISFEGDEKKGRVTGPGLDATYKVDGDKVTIVVTAKPFIISWNTIENKLKKYFSKKGNKED